MKHTDWPQGAPLQPTLGQMIRAYRLCWRWSERHGSFIRMTVMDRDYQAILIELHPLGLVPAAADKSKKHVVWWGDNEDDLLDSVPMLKMLRCVKKPWAFVTDYEGKFVGLA